MRAEVYAYIKQKIAELPNCGSLRYLKKHDLDRYFDQMVATVYLYTRPKKERSQVNYLVETVVAMGNTIRNRMKERRDSALAARTGAFFLSIFEELDILRVLMSKGNNGHQAYIVEVLQDDVLRSLWSELDPHQIEKMPGEVPYAPWTSYKHETGLYAIKTGNQQVIESISPETHPIVFDALNKPQTVIWRINKDIYNIFNWALKNKTEAFSDIWLQTNPEAVKTKLREAQTLYDMAAKFLDSQICHRYYFDFRGRRYTNTAYLNETGSDAAKGLLQRADKKPITKDGFFWLMVNIASNGAMSTSDGKKTDKLPLKLRFEWSLDNEEILLSYAENPKVNQGWMKADKPWQFLAGCFELLKFRKWQSAMQELGVEFDEYGYESHAEAYLDGTTNGSQHLCALTRDETTAPYVNLVKQEYPGDLYSYVAKSVWEKIEQEVNRLEPEELEDIEGFLDDLIELKKAINVSQPKSQVRKEAIEKIQKFKQENAHSMAIASAVFWNRIKDLKERRKIVKRNTMTIP